MTTKRIVTLLTDFGTADAYVAAMKGVTLSFAPYAEVVDACHWIQPGDVQAGAWVLGQYWALYPPGSIHVAVVDPGVGTERHALLAEADEHLFLAPDNGLLTWVLKQAREAKVGKLRREVHRPGEVSATFHGRDIFAYAAGLLAGGHAGPADLADPTDCLVVPEWGTVRKEADRLVGQIVHVDHFGNLITNILRRQVEEMGWASYAVQAGPMASIPLRKAYGDGEKGELLALYGSSGTLELAISCGSAAQSTVLKRGTAVTLLRTDKK
ncbi:MAG: SAM-dependent chlorinase/fluorinase [Verrucomicrobiota bacterium]